jgi:hypothetical protein
LNPWETTLWADYPDTNTTLAPDAGFGFGFGGGAAASFYDPPLFDVGGAGPMDWNDLTGSMRTGLTPAVQKPNPFDTHMSTLMTTPTLETVAEVQASAPSDKPDVIPCQKIWCVCMVQHGQ